jgi:hypothetical protein
LRIPNSSKTLMINLHKGVAKAPLCNRILLSYAK